MPTVTSNHSIPSRTVNRTWNVQQSPSDVLPMVWEHGGTVASAPGQLVANLWKGRGFLSFFAGETLGRGAAGVLRRRVASPGT